MYKHPAKKSILKNIFQHEIIATSVPYNSVKIAKLLKLVILDYVKLLKFEKISRIDAVTICKLLPVFLVFAAIVNSEGSLTFCISLSMHAFI